MEHSEIKITKSLLRHALMNRAWLIAVLFACSDNAGSSLSQEQINSLPSLGSFVDTPSSNFIVDFDQVSRTSPFVGSNNSSPHDGAHVHFENNGAIPDGSASTSYPPIYAVASGFIASVSTSTAVGENFKYEIFLAFASDEGKEVQFEYSIEPMIDPGSSDFYAPFLLVAEGQNVSAGETMAYMYIPEGVGSGTHIHFSLINDLHGKQAPVIFSSDILTEFTAKVEGDDSCMGTDMTSDENPQGTGEINCL